MKKNVKKLKYLLFLTAFALPGCVCCTYYKNKSYSENMDDNFCRIGMTTNLDKRKKYWLKRYKKEGKEMLNWSVIGSCRSQSSAQKMETREAKRQQCLNHQGGRDPKKKKKWYIYKIIGKALIAPQLPQ